MMVVREIQEIKMKNIELEGKLKVFEHNKELEIPKVEIDEI